MRRSLIIATASVAALPILSTPAWAQANRTFVSGSGSDANPCSLSAPCRSFTGAIAQTNAGGEIVALDSAGYGTATITKSISIIGPAGIEAGVTLTSQTDAIDISVGASDVVNLRGLTLIGVGAGANGQGIVFHNLGALNIENCVIRGFFNGIRLETTGSAAINVSDTIVSNVGNDAVQIFPSGSGTVTAVFNRVQAIGSVTEGFDIGGAALGGMVNATIVNSVVSNNQSGVGSVGIFVQSTSGQALTQLTVTNSVVSNNGIGVVDQGANSSIVLGRNTISGNTMAFSVGPGGSLFSFGDNYIRDNINDGSAIPLVATK